MVMGYSSGGNKLGSLSKYVKDEGSISINYRQKHMDEEKERVLRERARQDLEDRKRKLELNKKEIAQKESDVRRLQGEEAQAKVILQSITREMQVVDQHVQKLRTEYETMKQQIQAGRQAIDSDREKVNRETGNLVRYEKEIHELEQKLLSEKEIVGKVDREIQSLNSKIAHLNNDLSRAETAYKKEENQKGYKAREVEARKKLVSDIELKKGRQINEIQRLHGENARLEQEIKKLEQIARIH